MVIIVLSGFIEQVRLVQGDHSTQGVRRTGRAYTNFYVEKLAMLI